MPDWTQDLSAMMKGWQVLVRGKLYYDTKTYQYYDGDKRLLTYGEVARRYNFNPMKPETLFTPSQSPDWLTPRAQAAQQWREAGGERPAELSVGNAPAAVTDYQWQPSPEVIKESGWDWAPIRDTAGNIISYEPLGRTEADAEDKLDLEGINQWQHMNRQLGWEQQGRLSAEAMGRLWSREATEAREGELSVQQKADIFKSVQGQMLSGLDPITDAFQYWDIANKPNKWEQKINEGRDEVNPQDRVKKWEAQVKADRAWFKSVNDEIKMRSEGDLSRKPSYGEQQELDAARSSLMNSLQQAVLAERAVASPGFINRYSDFGENWGESASKWVAPRGDAVTGYEIGKPDKKRWLQPDTPPAPEWLSRYFPEATQMLDPTKYRTDQPLRAMQMGGLTPSAQAWNRWLPSEQAGFMSHTRWSGGLPEDTIGRMNQMLPQPKSGSRWTPFR